MIDKDVVIDIRKSTGTEGPFNTPTYSPKKEVYGTKMDAGAIEKERAKASGLEKILRIDINEEEFDDETIAYIESKEPDGEKETYDIYKFAPVKNKVLLYLSKRK